MRRRPPRSTLFPYTMLFRSQMHRCLDHHAAEQVAARAPAHRLHALVAQPEHAPGLSFGGNLQLHVTRSEEHTSELQSHSDLVCRLLLEKKKHINNESAQHTP